MSKKAVYRPRNWKAYNQSLVQKGSLTVWIDEDVLANWHPEPEGKRQRGGQLQYSDQAIETLLMLRAVYPTFLAAMSDLAHPDWRASALGVYRLWRDSGYAFGALLGGVLSDMFSIQVAVLTMFSGLITAIYLPETVQLSRVPITASELSTKRQDTA